MLLMNMSSTTCGTSPCLGVLGVLGVALITPRLFFDLTGVSNLTEVSNFTGVMLSCDKGVKGL